MPIDTILLSEKLRKYRNQFQLSLGELSASTGIPAENLASFEAGKSVPSGDVVLILADFYKCDFKFFISSERIASFEETETLFRHFDADLNKADRWAIQEFLFLCDCEQSLLSQGFGEKSVFPFSFTPTGPFFKGHGHEAAKALRRHLNYSDVEIGRNVYEDFRSIGLHIMRRRLENTAISGLFVRHPKAGLCILVNYNDDVYRQRFTVAHEAGHAILDISESGKVSFDRSSAKWSSSDLSEKRADAFASHFLCPPAFLSKLPAPERWNAEDVISWANKMRVSTTALGIALSEAKLISDAKKAFVLEQRVAGTDKEDPEMPSTLSPRAKEQTDLIMKKGLSSTYVRLCLKAFEQGAISRGRLAEVMLSEESDVPWILSLFGQRDMM